eukprot:TRINITY_DN9387_c0_g1_i1.p1 TRINITY_DN9387_c0_g1~~TRINITY_DN9387_c0_g1_i1.p1  ORF type:complete len:743 (+),score=128.51 TRINITY_DN9387_c0_g1_i1:3-2231(+)
MSQMGSTGLFGLDMDEVYGSQEVSSVIPSVARRQSKRRENSTASNLHISPTIRNMIGEANFLFSEKEYQKAIDVLREVIQKRDNIPESYNTLGLIYEELNKTKQAIRCYIRSAMLVKDDYLLWERIAEMAMGIGDVTNALFCFSKIIHLNKDSKEALWHSAVIYMERNEPEKACKYLQSLVEQFPSKAKYTKEYASCLKELGKKEKAFEVLENWISDSLYLRWNGVDKSFETRPEFIGSNIPKIDFDLVNMLSEIYIEKGMLYKSISIIDLATSGRDNIPVEITANFGISLAYTGSVDRARQEFMKIYTNSVDLYDDIFYAIGDACCTIGEYHMALDFLNKLVIIKEYDTPALWRQIAECHQFTGNFTGAIMYYEKVHESCKEDIDVMDQLLILYEQVGNHAGIHRLNKLIHIEGDFFETDLELPVPNFEGKKSILSHSIQKSFEYFDAGNYREFLEISFPFFQTLAKLNRMSRRESMESKIRECGHVNIFLLFIRTVITLDHMDKVNKRNMVVKSFDRLVTRDPKPYTATYYYVMTQLYKKRRNWEDAMECIRSAISQRPNDVHLWEEFYYIVRNNKQRDSNGKYIKRHVKKYPKSIPAHIMAGHDALNNRSYNIALSHYLPVYSQGNVIPIVTLCIGITYLNQAMARTEKNRHFQIFKGFAFLYKYHEQMNHSQESLYNLARAFHQLHLLNHAVNLYQKILKDNSDENISRLAAHNMIQIYKKSGNYVLARNLLMKYMVV